MRRQVARLKAAPPIVQKPYADKKIDIAGGVYDIATGKVTPVLRITSMVSLMSFASASVSGSVSSVTPIARR